MSKTNLPDYHLHTKFCGHAEGEIVEYIEKAISLGIKRIGFADHAPLMFQPNQSIEVRNLTMEVGKLREYYSIIQEQREKHKGKIEIATGLEVDYFPDNQDVFDIIGDFDFDFLLGSVHFVNNWGFDQDTYRKVYNRLDTDSFLNKYYSCVEALVESGKFDIVAHLDLPKKFNILPKKDLSDVWERILRKVKEKNMVLEVNSSGIAHPAEEIYPEKVILKIAYMLGIPVITGSDAHSPEQVGRHFENIEKLLREVGYSEVVYFHKREFEKIEF